MNVYKVASRIRLRPVPNIGNHILGEGTPRPQHRQPIKDGCRWLQMVADKTEHLQPRQVFDKQRVRPHFKGAVAELQIKSKTMFVQLLYKIKRPPLAHLPKKL